MARIMACMHCDGSGSLQDMSCCPNCGGGGKVLGMRDVRFSAEMAGRKNGRLGGRPRKCWFCGAPAIEIRPGHHSLHQCASCKADLAGKP